VVKAATNQACPKWAIFESKYPRFKYDADDDLDVSLSFLEQSLKMINNSTALYQLRFYEEMKDGSKINNETKYNCSLNFRLTQDEDDYWRKRNSFSDNQELQQRVLQLEAKLLEQEEEEEEPESLLTIKIGVKDEE